MWRGEQEGEGREADCLGLVDVVVQESHRPRRADTVGSSETWPEVRTR